ncbi:MAG: UbiX family flavin prenyltransferase [Campylobacter sp.]|nr:UbiX family flavin prenyltransferase [Campylobacter sp.]
MKILVGITGASLTHIGFKLLEALDKFSNAEIYCIVTNNAKTTLQKEKTYKFDEFSSKLQVSKFITFFDDNDISLPPASGSFGIDKTIIAPCSVNTLAKVSLGLSDTLLTRACSVALKERKKLILGVREMPFSTISLRQMSELSTLGVIIAPPVLASYGGYKSLEEAENFIVGKWLDLLKVEHNLYKRWE